MRRVCLIAGLLMTAACSLNNPGAEPPAGRIYFPTAIALADDHLLVASSNFDIRYNAGSLQAYDLTALNEQVDACLADASAAGCDCRQDRACVLANTRDLLASEVLIDSFATGVAYSAALGRVYVPTRGNGGLTFVDFADGALSCGQDGRCGPVNIAGIDPSRGHITMPSQPTSVATGAASDLEFVDAAGMALDAQYVLVGDRNRSLSLFLDTGGGAAPELKHVRPGLPGEISEMATADGAAYLSTVNDAQPSKLITQVGFDQESNAGSDFFFSYTRADLSMASFGSGSTVRSLAFVPGTTAELVAVTLNPSALVRLNLQSPRLVPNQPVIDSVVSLGTGPSKVAVGRIGTDARPFAFVSCFDSREIMVVDLDLRRLVSVIQGVTGPFSVAVDSARSRLYVGDFRSSTVRIIDLAPLVRRLSSADLGDSALTSPSVIAILGQPLDQQVLQ